ncbi:MAG: hypothetical protein U0Q11_16720 [Vicinamibacterales bacterium]
MRALRTLVAMLMLVTASTPSYAQTRRADSAESERYRTLAQALEPAAFVSLRLANGRQMTGTILSVSDESFRFQRHARIPEAPRDIRYDDIVSLERGRQGMNSGMKVLVGVGSSIATFLVVMLVAAVSIND